MFRGGFEHTVDDKGRVIIPLKFRPELGPKFIVTKGVGCCLFVLSETEWRVNFDEKFGKRNVLDVNTIKLQRHFCAEALDAVVDTQGRIAIPANLRKFAEIAPGDDVMIVGMTNRLEIWKKSNWDAQIESVSVEDLLSAANAIGVGTALLPSDN